jgi:hypothetical protein
VEETAVAQQPVVYGQPSGQADDAVVNIQSPGGNCSGTLVAPNQVLTARHCLAIFDRTAPLGCNQDGTSVTDAGNIASDYEPAEVAIIPGPGGCYESPIAAKRFFSTGSQTVCRNDLALIELAAPIVDGPTMPLRLLRPTSVGESMTIVGFGQSDNLDEVSVRRRRAGLSVLTVGANRFDDHGGMAVDGTFVLSQGACHGDSGGPAIAETTGAVAGVYSIKLAEDCTDPTATGVFVQVAEYYELILNTFDELGAEPWFEGEREPTANGDSSAKGCSLTAATGARENSGMVAALFSLWALRRRGARSPKLGSRLELT